MRQTISRPTFTRQAAAELVATIPHWHHRFEIYPGVMTPGSYDPNGLWSMLELEGRCQGARVLDIGASDGFFTQKIDDFGGDVTAVDFRSKASHGFGVMEKLLGKEFNYEHSNIFELNERRLGKFEIVLLLGVLYHLPDMMRALHKVRSLCDGTLLLETHSDNEFCKGFSAARYFKAATLAGDFTNFWSPNTQCVLDMLYDAGFDVVRHEAWTDRLLVEALVSKDPNRMHKMEVAYGFIGDKDPGGPVALAVNGAGSDALSAAAPLKPPAVVPASTDPLPIPPFEMRQLVGPTDESAFDNATGDSILEVPDSQFAAVLDFGCGCGRLARQLIQQRVRPLRYLGFDLHPGMIRWCQQNLAPRASGFEFRHHDVENAYFNPGEGKPPLLPMPAEDGAFSLVIALSVFTHTTQAHAEYYLKEVVRVLQPGGMLAASFFLFEKRYFPMMQDFQNALYINIEDPWNAVIFDREWLQTSLRNLGLGVVRAIPPGVRGFQWLLHIRRLSAGGPVIQIPEDHAPFGRMPPPIPVMDPRNVGAA